MVLFLEAFARNFKYANDHWNSHYIGRSRFDIIHGRPYLLFYLSELYGGVSDLLHSVAGDDLLYATNQLIDEKTAKCS